MEMTLLETIILGTLISADIRARASLPSNLEIPEILVTLNPPVPLVGHIDSLVLLWADPRVSRDQTDLLSFSLSILSSPARYGNAQW